MNRVEKKNQTTKYKHTNSRRLTNNPTEDKGTCCTTTILKERPKKTQIIHHEHNTINKIIKK